MTFLREAVRAVPQVRWALGVLGVAAATSLLFGLFTNKLVGIAGTVVMLFLMVLLVVFARGVATLAHTSLKIPALFFTWAAMILTIGCVALAASSVFFNWPLARRELLSIGTSWLGLAPPQLPTRELPFRDERVQLNRLLPGMLEALDNRAGEDETLRSLAERGSLRLDNACLVVGQPGEEPRTVALSLYTLSMNGNSCIVTNGNTLDLTVVEFLGAGAIIRSFDEPALTPADAPAGATGINGRNGGTVSIRVLRRIVGPTSVDLRGQNGGRGGQGTVGLPGQSGSRGADAVRGVFDCRAGGQDGGSGGKGSQGGPGAQGGTGGDGGTLILIGVAARDASQMSDDLRGGAPGLGGAGGPGGPGGGGGLGGSGDGLCSGGHAGAMGPAGETGLPGSPGSKSGSNGRRVQKASGS